MLRTSIITATTTALLMLSGHWGLHRVLDAVRPMVPPITFESLQIGRGSVGLGSARLHHPKLTASARRVTLVWSDSLRPVVDIEDARAQAGPIATHFEAMHAEPTAEGWRLNADGRLAAHRVELRGVVSLATQTVRLWSAAGPLYRGRIKGADVQVAAVEARRSAIRMLDVDARRGSTWWGGGELLIERAACGLRPTFIGGQAWYAPGGDSAGDPHIPSAPTPGRACPVRVADLRVVLRTPLGVRSVTVDAADMQARSVAVRAHGPEGQGAVVMALDRHWGYADGELDLAQVPRLNGAAGAVRGQLAVVRVDDTTLAHVRARVDAVLQHPAIAVEAVDLSGLRVDAHLRHQGDVYEVQRATVERVGVQATGRLVVDAATVDLHATLRPTDCQALWDAIPAALRGPYADARLSGRVAPALHFRMPRANAMKLALDWTGPSDCQVDALNAHPAHVPPVTVAGARDDVDWLLRDFRLPVQYATRAVEVGPGTDAYVPIAQLPRWVGAAAIVSEDNSFNRGKALNLGLLRRALMFNLDRGRYVYGGSTIPQQLAKNLFLTRRKTLARKLQEAIVAMRMVQVVPTRRILELYLNCIEFAPNVYGIERAARYYFQKGARHLTPKEAAFLGISKPSPRYAAAMRRRGSTPDTPHFREYMRRIVERMRKRGAISSAQAAAARPFRIRWRGGRKISDPQNRPQNDQL